MAVKLYYPMALDHFKYEGDIIGRLVVEYGELEWSLCLLSGNVLEDFDIAIKTLYRARGEQQRIDLADALIRNKIPTEVRQTYEQTVAHMRECLKIRNRYAHSNWVHAASNGLCYVDVEELAKRNDRVETGDAELYKLDRYLVEDQARFFNEVLQNLTYLCMEVQYINGNSVATGFHYVTNIRRPEKPTKVIMES